MKFSLDKLSNLWYGVLVVIFIFLYYYISLFLSIGNPKGTGFQVECQTAARNGLHKSVRTVSCVWDAAPPARGFRGRGRGVLCFLWYRTKLLLTDSNFGVILSLEFSEREDVEGSADMKLFSDFGFVLSSCFILVEIPIFLLGDYYKKRQNHRGILLYRLLLAAEIALFYLLFFIHYGFNWG